MSKLKTAWEHIRTLKGSNYGSYYSNTIDSKLTFEEDEIVMDEFLGNQFTSEEIDFLLMSEEERVNTKNCDEIWNECKIKLEKQRAWID